MKQNTDSRVKSVYTLVKISIIYLYFWYLIAFNVRYLKTFTQVLWVTFTFTIVTFHHHVFTFTQRVLFFYQHCPSDYNVEAKRRLYKTSPTA